MPYLSYLNVLHVRSLMGGVLQCISFQSSVDSFKAKVKKNSPASLLLPPSSLCHWECGSMWVAVHGLVNIKTVGSPGPGWSYSWGDLLPCPLRNERPQSSGSLDLTLWFIPTQTLRITRLQEHKKRTQIGGKVCESHKKERKRKVV